MTQEQKQFTDALETLVHGRFNRKSLERTIRSFLPPRTHMKFGWDLLQQCTDFEMCFEVCSDRSGCYGFYSIYYLPMRRRACLELGDANRFYVTEIGYEFY